MKTYEHALISLGYAAGVSFLSVGVVGLADPALYLSALIGGEVIDLLHHPLYHLVYQRNNEWVVKVRHVFRQQGFRAAISVIGEIEDKLVT